MQYWTWCSRGWAKVKWLVPGHVVGKGQCWPLNPALDHKFMLFFFKNIILFILVVLGLHCCTGFSLVALSRGYSLLAEQGLLIVVASLVWGFPGGSDGKESACKICLQQGRPRFEPGLGRCPGKGNGYPLWYSCLESSMDRGAWRATISPWDHKELDMTEQLSLLLSLVADHGLQGARASVVGAHGLGSWGPWAR